MSLCQHCLVVDWGSVPIEAVRQGDTSRVVRNLVNTYYEIVINGVKANANQVPQELLEEGYGV